MKRSDLVLVSRVGIFAFIAIIVLSSLIAAQRCDLTGEWTMQQENGIRVMLSLKQNKANVAGSASYQGKKQGHAHMEIGQVVGSSERIGNNPYTFFFSIKWEYGETGIYRGYLQNKAADSRTYTPTKIFRGNAYIAEDASNRDRRTDWRILEAIPCVRSK